MRLTDTFSGIFYKRESWFVTQGFPQSVSDSGCDSAHNFSH